MRRIREDINIINRKNFLNKTFKPILVASILLITFVLSSFNTSLVVSANPISVKVSKDEKIKVTKSVSSVENNDLEFDVELKIENIYSNKIVLDKTLYSISINDVVNDNFTVVNGTVENAIQNGNTILKQNLDLNKKSEYIIKYRIKAKEGSSGDTLINTDKSQITYAFKEWGGNWTGTLQIKSPSVYIQKPHPVDPVYPDEGKVTLNKTAEALDDGRYRINFDIFGKIQTADPKKADIVLLIDRSGSMAFNDSGVNTGYSNSRLKSVKESSKKLIADILSNYTINKGNNIRIAISSFAQSGSNDTNGFSNNINYLKGIIGGENGGFVANGGTNTQSGIRVAGELLDKSKRERPDAKRYVVMFTDGLPTYYLDNSNTVKGPGDWSPDICFGKAQEEYNKVIGGITKLGGIGGNSVEYWYTPQDVEKKDGKHPNTDFYSVGLLSNKQNESSMMKKFLSTTQNVIQADKFADKYCKADMSGVTDIFNDITNKIIQSISSIIDNASIDDTITGDFVIPSDLGVNGKDVTVKVNDKVINDREVINSIVSNKQGQNIKLDLSKIPQVGDKDNNVKISVSFIVNAKDPYFGSENIETNEGDAVLTYNDPITKEVKKISVISPKVNIEPVQGTIKIFKNVNNNNIIKAEKTVNEFPVYIERIVGTDGFNSDVNARNNKIERYDFKVSGNSSQEMNFYMRGNITEEQRINNATDNNKSFITAGKYRVKEIVPMDYKLAKIEYSYNNQNWTAIKGNETFIIDKNHKNVYIRISNSLSNNRYWRDTSDSVNTFDTAA